jgi:hypothetical protein
MANHSGIRWRSHLAEAVAVLGGVLAAFSVDAWWGQRADRQREVAYLAALEAEVAATQQVLADHLKYLTGSMEAARDFLQLAAEPDSPGASADSITNLLYVLGPFRDFSPERAALDDLTSSGGLAIIRSQTLRRSLAAYERQLARNRTAQEEVQQFWRLELSPFYNEHGNLRGMLQSGQVGEDITLAELPFQPDRAAFLSRHHANMLMHRIFLTERVRNRHAELQATIFTLLELLDDQLGPETRP